MRNVIYIDRNYLYFYGSNVHAPIVLQFAPTTVKDMELINYDELEKQIDALIQTNKIIPEDTGIVISHQSSFEKLIDIKIVGVDLDMAKKKFLDNVPFEEIIYKEFPSTKGLRVVAVNKELIYAIKNIFQQRAFRLVTIASIAAIYPDNDVPFNTALAQEFLKKSSVLSQGTFPVEDIEIPTTDIFDESNKPVKNNNRLFLLIGVFAILIGSLVIVLLLRNQAPEPVTKSKINPTTIPTPTAMPQEIVPSQTVTLTLTILPSVKSATSIQILNGSGLSGQADQLKKAIEDAGYSTITTGNANTLESTRSLVIFKPTVSAEVRQEITGIVSKLVGELTIQENAEVTSDIVITTARTDTTPITPTP